MLVLLTTKRLRAARFLSRLGTSNVSMANQHVERHWAQLNGTLPSDCGCMPHYFRLSHIVFLYRPTTPHCRCLLDKSCAKTICFGIRKSCMQTTRLTQWNCDCNGKASVAQTHTHITHINCSWLSVSLVAYLFRVLTIKHLQTPTSAFYKPHGLTAQIPRLFTDTSEHICFYFLVLLFSRNGYKRNVVV